MTEYKPYRRIQTTWMAAWTPEIDMTDVSISQADLDAGSPKPGDFVAYSPAKPKDRWLINAEYAAANLEPLD